MGKLGWWQPVDLLSVAGLIVDPMWEEVSGGSQFMKARVRFRFCPTVGRNDACHVEILIRHTVSKRGYLCFAVAAVSDMR